MKKSTLLFIILILIVIFLFIFFYDDIFIKKNPGDISEVEITINSDGYHNEEDIRKCIDLYLDFFSENYYNSKLINITYDSNESSYAERLTHEKYEGEIISLKVYFKV